jgi:PAS domain S-box-containing protein
MEILGAAPQLEAILDASEDAIVCGDLDDTILVWNPGAEKMFGYAAHEVLGSSVFILNPPESPSSGAGSELPIREAIPRGRGIEQYETIRRHKDGTRIDVALTLSPVKDARRQVVGFCKIFRDLTDRRRVREHQILLQEIHHRVKNNLAVISSLFFLESTYAQEEQTVQLLQESQERVRSMALVHETLYRSGNFASIDFSQYVSSLAAQLMQSYRTTACNVHLETEIQSLGMTIDQAVPCGLILNELISNSLKHAFPGRDTGEIKVSLKREDCGMYLLEVSDNGVGLPAGLDPIATHTLGLRLVRSLTGQLSGSFELVAAGRGASARLRLELIDNGRR